MVSNCLSFLPGDLAASPALSGHHEVRARQSFWLCLSNRTWHSSVYGDLPSLFSCKALDCCHSCSIVIPDCMYDTFVFWDWNCRWWQWPSLVVLTVCCAESKRWQHEGLGQVCHMGTIPPTSWPQSGWWLYISCLCVVDAKMWKRAS